MLIEVILFAFDGLPAADIIGRTVIALDALFGGDKNIVEQHTVFAELIVNTADGMVAGHSLIIHIEQMENTVHILPALNEVAGDGIVILIVHLEEAGAGIVHVVANGAHKMIIDQFVAVSGCRNSGAPIHN